MSVSFPQWSVEAVLASRPVVRVNQVGYLLGAADSGDAGHRHETPAVFHRSGPRRRLHMVWALGALAYTP